MEYLTAEYLREIECYHHVRFPEDDPEEFEREFRETLAQDPILRASLLFFVLDEDAPHSAKIKSSVLYIKAYFREKRDAEIDKDLEHQQVDTDDDDGARGNGDSRREDNNRFERAAPQDVQYFRRLVEIAMQEDSTAVVLPDRSNVTATAAAIAEAESESLEPSPWLYEEEPIYEIHDVQSILSGVLARAGLLFATAPAA